MSSPVVGLRPPAPGYRALRRAARRIALVDALMLTACGIWAAVNIIRTQRRDARG